MSRPISIAQDIYNAWNKQEPYLSKAIRSISLLD